DAFVDELYVEEAHRGRGAGGLALRLAEDACRAVGVRALHLEVDRENHRARAVYEKAGFEDRDNHLLTKRLAQSPLRLKQGTRYQRPGRSRARQRSRSPRPSRLRGAGAGTSRYSTSHAEPSPPPARYRSPWGRPRDTIFLFAPCGDEVPLVAEPRPR